MGTLIKRNPAEWQIWPCFAQRPLVCNMRSIKWEASMPQGKGDIEGQICAFPYPPRKTTIIKKRRKKRLKNEKSQREEKETINKMIFCQKDTIEFGEQNKYKRAIEISVMIVNIWLHVECGLRPLDIAISLRSGGRSSVRSVCPRAFASATTLFYGAPQQPSIYAPPSNN